MSARRQQRSKAVHTASRADEDRKFARKALFWTKVSGIGAVLAILVTIVLYVIPRFQDSASSHAAAPHIEVDSVTAQYVPSRTGIPARPVMLDFEIRNTGNQLALITAARVTVQQFAALPVCFSAGALISSGTYNAFLPEKQPSGQSVNITMHDQILPDGADRFDITLGLPAGHPFNPNIYAYRIHIGLLYDNSSVPTDAGEAVIALPIAPDDSYFWTKQYAAHPTAISMVPSSYIPSVRRCLVNNSRKLKSILAMKGARPAELSAIQSQLST